MRRIFIAINLSEDVKRKLQECQREWADLPVRFVKKNSLHLTVLFIGYVDDERMLDVCKEIHEIAKKHKAFELEFNRVRLGPPNKPPRLIWMEGEKSEELAKLKEEIEKALYSDDSKIKPATSLPVIATRLNKPATSLLVIATQLRNFGAQHNEKKELIPHITLARIRQFDWWKLEEKPQIDKEIFISIPVDSIEVMESDLARNGAEYAVLESADLCC